jgi:hypothetical protein
MTLGQVRAMPYPEVLEWRAWLAVRAELEALG